jgi:dihydroneopterin aldolase
MGDAASDRIELRGLRLVGHHGVLPEERTQGQPFVVDLVLELDTSAAARTDDLTQTVDYSVIAAAIAAVVTGEPVDLIETLAQRIADVCLAADAKLTGVEVTVHKPEAPVGQPVDDVVVHIRRERR